MTFLSDLFMFYEKFPPDAILRGTLAKYDLGHILSSFRNSSNTLFSSLLLIVSLKTKNGDVPACYLGVIQILDILHSAVHSL